MSCGLSPRPTESDPCGSKSTSSTLRPNSASDAPRLIVVVVLPTPPFWLHIETIRALPWIEIGRGSGRSGHGRPVGPIAGSAVVVPAPAATSPVVEPVTGALGSVPGSERWIGMGSVVWVVDAAAAGGVGTGPSGGISDALEPFLPVPKMFTSRSLSSDWSGLHSTVHPLVRRAGAPVICRHSGRPSCEVMVGRQADREQHDHDRAEEGGSRLLAVEEQQHERHREEH